MLGHTVFVVALLWATFIALHVGLTTRRIRSALVARMGERGYVALFSTIASVTFALAVAAYAAHMSDGPRGLALGGVTWLRPMLIAATVLGIVLMNVGFAVYPGSPYDLEHVARSPRGIERVTRHPFFAGTVLFGVAHALLATHLVGTLFGAGLALLATAGAWHQDRKLLARLGRPYADYLAATSAVPFAAIAAGRQRLVVRELPAGAAVVGVVIAIALRAVHASIFAYGGAFVVTAVVGGAAVITWQSVRRARRVEVPARRAGAHASMARP
jgi:uncharacterized membrane protein